MFIQLSEIVNDTYSNSSGYSLYLQMKEAFSRKERVEISFKDSTPTSSSFLNSSFGALIEEFGLIVFMELVVPKEITTGQSHVLKRYVSTFRNDLTI